MKLVNEIVSRTGKNITKPQKALTSIVRRVVAAVDVLKKAGLFRGGAEVQPKKSELNATADMAAFRAIQAQEIKEPESCNGWICIDISITGIILALKGFVTGFVQIAAFLGAAFEAFCVALCSFQPDQAPYLI
ncbi:unnamed protein product [Closterium sp. Naga37s-1]|nr:unnamed protein product [Closterium sp. Naga37s-1]